MAQEWIFIPIPSHSYRKNAIPSQFLTIVKKKKVLFRPGENDFKSRLAPVQIYSHSSTAPILEVNYIKKKKKKKILLDNPASIYSCEVFILYRLNSVIKGKNDSNPVGILRDSWKKKL